MILTPLPKIYFTLESNYFSYADHYCICYSRNFF